MKSNILFINRNFYEYDGAIKNELEARGNCVWSYSINFKLTPLLNILAHIDEAAIYKALAQKQQKKMLAEIEKNNYQIDVVFVLSGQMLRNDTLEKLKKMYPKASFVWYLWDNTFMIPEFSANKEYFDTVISFDMMESLEKGFVYLPLFYLKSVNEQERVYDWSFIGNAHSNRKRIIETIIERNACKKKFVYLKTGIYTLWKYRILEKKSNVCPYLKTKCLEYKKVIDVLSKSKSVLDIQMPGQTGLTMRTIEALGTHTKVITTNESVCEYDFYNQNNIFVLNAQTLQMPSDDFFKTPYEEVEPDIFESYRIDRWIDRLAQFF